MKIGIIQNNQTTGDFPRNVRKLIDSYRLCLDRGAEIVVSSAQSLCGPGLGDLVMRSGYKRQNRDALHYLSKEIGTVPLIVGTITPDDDESMWGFHNAAYILKNNSVELLASQQTIHDDGISNDSRYFIATGEPRISNINGTRVGILIGPDCPSLIEDSSCDLIIRLTSLPWSIGNIEACTDDDIALAEKYHTPVIRVSMVGGHERNIYAGASSVINKSGNLIKRLALFEEDCAVIDTEAKPVGDHLPGLTGQVHKGLVMGIRDFVTKSGFSSVCLGLSGGIDSALVAALAADALGSENVYGITMPGPYSSRGSIDDSYALAKNLGIFCETINIAPSFAALKDSLSPLFCGMEEDMTEENMQARIRGLMLMSYSNKFGHLLLSTGNKSEIAVGYSTMYGDSCGGLLPIGDLYKTEVYELSNYLNSVSNSGEKIPLDTINKPPSAELSPGQTDQNTLPPYEILDEIIRELMEYGTSATDLADTGKFEEQTVRRIQRLLKTSEWKKQQIPPILRLSTYSFGPERQIPFIHRFND